MEMVVAMSLLAIFLTIFGSVMFSVYRTSGRFRSTANAVQSVDVAFNALDHSIRYASYVSRPGQGASGSWYVEWLDASTDPNTCGQLRLDPTAGTLDERTWEDAASPGAWRTLATGVQATGQPFELTTASGSVRTAQLTVSFTAVEGQAQDRASAATLVTLPALNTSAATPTAGYCSGMRS